MKVYNGGENIICERSEIEKGLGYKSTMHSQKKSPKFQ